MPKAKEQEDRESLEAQLMGGEVQEDGETEGQEQGEIEEKAVSQEPETPAEGEKAPEISLDELQSRLAKIEQERENLQTALREEREGRKTSDRNLAAILERIEEAKKAQEEAQIAPPPKYEDDPAAYLAHQNQLTLDEIRKLKEEREKERSQSKEQEQFNQFLTEYQRQVDTFANQTPDYNEAAQFLAKVRDDELQTLGIMDPDERMKVLHQDALQIGAYAMQKGQNPAKIFYELAKKRGFQKSAPTPATPAPKPEVKSLSEISGGAPGGKETLQARAERIIQSTNFKDILSISQDEMESVLKASR